MPRAYRRAVPAKDPPQLGLGLPVLPPAAAVPVQGAEAVQLPVEHRPDLDDDAQLQEQKEDKGGDEKVGQVPGQRL